jgi:hypothetical protein
MTKYTTTALGYAQGVVAGELPGGSARGHHAFELA